MKVDYTGMAEDLKGDLKKVSDKNKRSEEQANKTSELKSCPFCGWDSLYETFEVNDIGTTIPVIFCNSCKIIFKVENDSPYLEDDKTYEYLKKKNINAWNNRKPVEKVMERLEEERDKNRNKGLELEKEGLFQTATKYYNRRYAFITAIKIIKEEVG